MKELIKQYLDNGISRRKLMRGLATAGLTTAAAKGLADSFTPTAAEAAEPGAIRSFTGTGGAHYVQQLKSAGVEYAGRAATPRICSVAQTDLTGQHR